MSKEKTYLDVLEETIAYYSEDPSRRSINPANGRCMYNGPDGRKCGVARCCSKIPEEFESQAVSNAILEKYLLPEYAHLDNLEFWSRIQNLHDDKSNWDDEGLSYFGEFVSKIMTSMAEELSGEY